MKGEKYEVLFNNLPDGIDVVSYIYLVRYPQH